MDPTPPNKAQPVPARDPPSSEATGAPRHLLFVYDWQPTFPGSLFAFALDRDGEVHRLECRGFEPWFYLLRPEAEHLLDGLACTRLVRETRESLYGRTPRNVTRAFFASDADRRKAVRELERERQEARDAEPWLAEEGYDFGPVVQALAQSGLPAVGWVRLDATVDDDRRELALEWCRLRETFVLGEEGIAPTPLVVHDDALLAPPLPKRLSFDIETYFPDREIPKGADGFLLSRQQDCVTCITLLVEPARRTTGRGVPEASLPPSQRIAFVLKGREPVDPERCRLTELVECASEAELLDRFVREVERQRCVLWIGYNTLCFDMSFLTLKMTRYEQERDLRTRWLALSPFSPLDGSGRARRPVGGLQGREYTSRENDAPKSGGAPKSGAPKSGGQRLANVHTVLWPGVLQIDLFALVLRQFNLKSNSLKAVSAHFLDGETKDDLTPEQMFVAHENGRYADLTKYCMQDTALVARLFDVLHVWPTLVQQAGVCRLGIFELLTGGEQKRSFNLLYRQMVLENLFLPATPPFAQRDGRFKGATVLEPVRGLYRGDTASFDFASLYPSIIMAYNLCHTTYVRAADVGVTVPPGDVHVARLEFHEGCVHDPRRARLAHLDEALAALKENHEKERLAARSRLEGLPARSALRRRLEADVDEELARLRRHFAAERERLSEERRPLYEALRDKPGGPGGPGDVYCTQSGDLPYTEHAFLKRGVRHGLLPRTLEKLVAERKAVRALGDAASGATERLLLEKRQLALKIIANAAYGMCGASNGRLVHAPISHSVTHYGREAFATLAAAMRDEGGEILYGDTDSSYVRFPAFASLGHAEVVAFCRGLAGRVSARFPPPMRLEFEHHYSRLLLLQKKTYFSTRFRDDGGRDPRIFSKGTKLDRNEWPSALQTAYRKTVEALLFREEAEARADIDACLAGLVEALHLPFREMLPGWVFGSPLESHLRLSPLALADVALVKKIRSDYSKHVNVPAHAHAAEAARKLGHDVSTGTMVPHVVCVVGGENAPSGSAPLAGRVFHLEVLRAGQTGGRAVRVDGRYYAEAIAKSAEALVRVVFADFAFPSDPPSRPLPLESFLALLAPAAHRPDLLAEFAEARRGALANERRPLGDALDRLDAATPRESEALPAERAHRQALCRLARAAWPDAALTLLPDPRRRVVPEPLLEFVGALPSYRVSARVPVADPLEFLVAEARLFRGREARLRDLWRTSRLPGFPATTTRNALPPNKTAVHRSLAAARERALLALRRGEERGPSKRPPMAEEGELSERKRTRGGATLSPGRPEKAGNAAAVADATIPVTGSR